MCVTKKCGFHKVMQCALFLNKKCLEGVAKLKFLKPFFTGVDNIGHSTHLGSRKLLVGG